MMISLDHFDTILADWVSIMSSYIWGKPQRHKTDYISSQ